MRGVASVLDANYPPGSKASDPQGSILQLNATVESLERTDQSFALDSLGDLGGTIAPFHPVLL